MTFPCEAGMRMKVTKWGNSLAVRLPRGFAAEAGVGEGSEVDMSLDGGNILIRPVEGPSYDLDDLLDRITPDNLHGEVDSGRGVGREAW